jgi:hypothetical protein
VDPLFQKITRPGPPHHNLARRKGHQQDDAGSEPCRNPRRFITTADQDPPESKEQNHCGRDRSNKVTCARWHSRARRPPAGRITRSAGRRAGCPGKELFRRIVIQEFPSAEHDLQVSIWFTATFLHQGWLMRRLVTDLHHTQLFVLALSIYDKAQTTHRYELTKKDPK